MKKGLTKIILGVTLFLIGLTIELFLIFSLFVSAPESQVTFTTPGSGTISVTEPGKYYVWNNYKAIHDGEVFNTSKDLPNGMKISVSDSNGTSYKFISDTSTSSSSGNSSKISVGYVEVNEPQDLTISVTGERSPRVFSFSRSNLANILIVVLLGGTCFCVGLIGGLILVILGVTQLMNKPKSTPAVATPPALPRTST